MATNSVVVVAERTAGQELQERMATALASVGYSGNPAKLSQAVERNPKLLAFLEWTVGQITTENHVSLEQSKVYEKLQSEGKVLEGRALQDALSRLGETVEDPAALEKEVEGLKARSASLKGQLQTLNAVHRSLSEHHASVLHQRDECSRQKSDMKRRCHDVLQEVGGRCKNVDVALEDLSSAVRDLCGSHRRERGTTSTSDLHLLSDVSQESYHQSEDGYLLELVNYTKKQFFKGIAEVAQFQAPGEQEYQFSPVDLDNSTEVILRGVSEDQYQQHQWELRRLQAVYPAIEMDYINSLMAQKHAQAANTRAKQELELLSHTPSTELEVESLRHQVAERQQRVSELQAMMESCAEERLRPLLQEMAALQVTRVLHGDYDLKIARQDAIIHKQDQVIARLRSQRYRHELLAMLYEVELRRHRDTHRLLATTEHHLTQLGDGRRLRSECIQAPSLRKAVPRTSLDSTDTLAQELCAILGVKAEGVVPLLSQEDLVEAVKKLCQQTAMLEGVVAASDLEIKHLLEAQDALTCQLERELFTGSTKTATGSPIMCVQEYTDHCAALTALIGSLEEQLKLLVKDYDSKKKLLKADSLLETERKLFVHFFCNPSHLNHVLGDLAKRIDSIALAS